MNHCRGTKDHRIVDDRSRVVPCAEIVLWGLMHRHNQSAIAIDIPIRILSHTQPRYIWNTLNSNNDRIWMMVDSYYLIGLTEQNGFNLLWALTRLGAGRSTIIFGGGFGQHTTSMPPIQPQCDGACPCCNSFIASLQWLSNLHVPIVVLPTNWQSSPSINSEANVVFVHECDNSPTTAAIARNISMNNLWIGCKLQLSQWDDWQQSQIGRLTTITLSILNVRQQNKVDSWNKSIAFAQRTEQNVLTRNLLCDFVNCNFRTRDCSVIYTNRIISPLNRIHRYP